MGMVAKVQSTRVLPFGWGVPDLQGRPIECGWKKACLVLKMEQMEGPSRTGCAMTQAGRKKP